MATIQLVLRPVSAASSGTGLDSPNMLGGYHEFLLYTIDAGAAYDTVFANGTGNTFTSQAGNVLATRSRARWMERVTRSRHGTMSVAQRGRADGRGARSGGSL